MNLKSFNIFKAKAFQDIEDSCSSGKPIMRSHKEFQERLRKTLYYGKYADTTLPSPIATDVAVRLINSRTNDRKTLDRHHAAKLTRRARISPCALMMGILYTERLAQSNPGYLKKVSSSDLFVVSMLVASKYLYDNGEDDDAYNYDWCKAGHYRIRDLNRLERDFLNSIDWRLFVSNDEFFDLTNRLEARIAMDHGEECGWYSYLDMTTILQNLAFQKFFISYLKSTGKTILACTVVYTFSIAVLFAIHPLVVNRSELRAQTFNLSKSQSTKLEHSEVVSLVRDRHENTKKSKHEDVKQNFSRTMTSHVENKNICGNCGIKMMDTTGSEAITDKHSAKSSDNSINSPLLACPIDKMSLMKLTFGKSTWSNIPVEFPVWENHMYSNIGFTTSAAA